jgi:hypothetical protein
MHALYLFFRDKTFNELGLSVLQYGKTKAERLKQNGYTDFNIICR